MALRSAQDWGGNVAVAAGLSPASLLVSLRAEALGQPDLGLQGLHGQTSPSSPCPSPSPARLSWSPRWLGRAPKAASGVRTLPSPLKLHDSLAQLHRWGWLESGHPGPAQSHWWALSPAATTAMPPALCSTWAVAPQPAVGWRAWGSVLPHSTPAATAMPLGVGGGAGSVSPMVSAGGRHLG